jgi:hypothetical protein
MCDGDIATTLVLFSNEAWFHLSGYVNSQNNRQWSKKNPIIINGIPLHGVKVGVWCAMSAGRTTKPTSSKATYTDK